MCIRDSGKILQYNNKRQNILKRLRATKRKVIYYHNGLTVLKEHLVTCQLSAQVFFSERWQLTARQMKPTVLSAGALQCGGFELLHGQCRLNDDWRLRLGRRLHLRFLRTINKSTKKLVSGLGKGFLYSLPSTGPGAVPDVPAVSTQVT